MLLRHHKGVEDGDKIDRYKDQGIEHILTNGLFSYKWSFVFHCAIKIEGGVYIPAPV